MPLAASAALLTSDGSSQRRPANYSCPVPTQPPASLAAAVVLAAGAGTRMRSATPKMLHPLGGRTLLGHALTAASATGPGRLAVVVRHQRDLVAAHVTEIDRAAELVDQDEIPGTGRAVQCALEALDAPEPLEGPVLVMAGDVPLLDAGILSELAAAHAAEGNAITLLTATLQDATGYGRVLRSGGQVTGIVEERDASAEQRAITEINTSTYVFDAAVLRRALRQVGRENAQGEVYLTDVIALAHAEGLSVRALQVEDPWAVEGVNDRVQLAALGAELNRRTLEGWMRAGVTVVDPASTWIDVTVELAEDVTLAPGTQLHGTTTVGAGASIGPDTTLTDCKVGERAEVIRTHGTGAVIGADAVVGPFAYLRPETALGVGGKIGTFVETKNATIGDGAKVPHLSYVGDAEIGEGTNIGAASVFVNYDGVTKRRTRVGRHARTGSDNMFVAPVTVGDGAYTGAGTVIRQDVPPGALAVPESGQRNIPGWVQRKRPGTPAAEAASHALSPQSDSTTTDDVDRGAHER